MRENVKMSIRVKTTRADLLLESERESLPPHKWIFDAKVQIFTHSSSVLVHFVSLFRRYAQISIQNALSEVFWSKCNKFTSQVEDSRCPRTSI